MPAKKSVKKVAKKKPAKKVCKTFDVVCVGSATVDVFAKTDSELIKIETKHDETSLIAYPAGSKILVREIEFLCGGGGTNTSVAFRRLGVKSAFLGKLGMGDNSKKILDHLAEEKVPFVGSREPVMSGYSIILDSIEEDRTILTYKGTNNDLRYDQLNCSAFKSKWLYLASMVGESYKTLERLAIEAKKNSTKVIFNPSNYLTNKGVPYLKKTLANTDILILNDEEAISLCGKNSHDYLLKALHVFGPGIVVITMGKKGAIASDMKHIYTVKPPKVKVIETTGAGDAFGAGFVTGLMKKDMNIEYALKLGIAVAGHCIQSYGSHIDLPTMNQARSFISSKKIKVKKVKAR